MIFCTIPPSTHLQAVIKSYTLAHFRFDKGAPGPIKPFPVNPQQCLVFYLRGNITAFHSARGTSIRFPQIAVNGAQLGRFDFHLTHEFLMLSVNFQPGGLSKFLRMPLSDEFLDVRIDAQALLGPDIHQLYERLVNVHRYEAIIPIIESYLWQRISRLKIEPHPIDQVCRIIAERPSLFSLNELAGQACLSPSQFERRFTRQLGISPKLFARTNRFYKAYQLKDQNPRLDWLTIALQTGYSDYQHLVKDFRQFAGETPNSLLLAQSQAPERILGIG
jgi:AraC-like DNA-binding protein